LWPEPGKGKLTGPDLLGLPLVELVASDTQVDGYLRCRTFARIEQPDRFGLELCGEPLALDHVTPPRGLSPFKGVRQTRAISRSPLFSLLLSALAAFGTWLVGMACEASGIDQWLTPFRSKRRLYSVMRWAAKR